jgi:hypothetical protein
MRSGSDRGEFVLRIRPLPNTEPIRSLRWVLKHLLRQHGFVCTDIRQVRNAATDTDVRTDD